MTSEAQYWYHPDEGVAPEASADPWTKTGAGTVTVSDEWLTLVAAGVVVNWGRYLFPAAASPLKRDRVVVELTFRGSAGYVAAGGREGPWGITIDDGSMALALAIGSKLELVVPSTGALILELSGSFDYLGQHDIRFVKDGSYRWVVYVDEAAVGALPYGLAEASTSTPYILWGMNGVGADSGTSYWRNVEAGLNIEIPRNWRVRRFQRTLPALIQANWNEAYRAVLRSVVGIFEASLSAMEEAFAAITGGSQNIDRYTASGKIPADEEDPAWTENGPTGLSIVRERIRIDSSANTSGSSIEAPITVSDPAGKAWYAKATFTLRSNTLDAVAGDSKVGPHVTVANGEKGVAAYLMDMGDLGYDDGVAWVLCEHSFTVAAVVLGMPWRVSGDGPHTVEVLLIKPYYAWLIVDGQVVDRVAYSSLAASADEGAWVGAWRYNQAPANLNPLCVVDVEDAEAALVLHDDNRRELFLQTLVERLVFVGGCERNVELDQWNRRHHGVQELRGTTRGIILEFWRMTCSQSAAIVTETEYGDWYLEVSYPEVTPIYLESNAEFLNVFVEFPTGSLNFTPQELADLAARYLVPYSTVELTYYVCLATLTTGAAVVAAGLDQYPVVDSTHFSVGDDVTVHDSTNTTIYNTTVSAIPDSTHVHVPSQATTVASGGTIRKVLATT